MGQKRSWRIDMRDPLDDLYLLTTYRAWPKPLSRGLPRAKNEGDLRDHSSHTEALDSNGSAFGWSVVTVPGKKKRLTRRPTMGQMACNLPISRYVPPSATY